MHNDACGHPVDNFYVIDMIRDRLNLMQRVALVFRLHQKYRPVRSGGVRYEKYGMQADIEALKREMTVQNYRFDITEVAGQTQKEDRIKRLMPAFEQGRFYLPATCYYTGYDGKTRDLSTVFVEEEYRSFPVSQHDDMLDCLARIMEPDLPLQWPKKMQGRGMMQSFADTAYQIFS